MPILRRETASGAVRTWISTVNSYSAFTCSVSVSPEEYMKISFFTERRPAFSVCSRQVSHTRHVLSLLWSTTQSSIDVESSDKEKTYVFPD